MKKLLTILSIFILTACTRQVQVGAGEKPAVHTPQEIAQDAAINLYVDKGDRLEKVMLQSLSQSGEAKIELLKSEPKAILSKWNGEVKMGMKYKGIQATGDREFLTNRMKWKDASEELYAYPIAVDDDGLEIELVLKSKPTKNTFDFTIDGAEQLNFYYQTPLWQEAGLPAPTADCTDTDCTINGDIDQRPENVVGSYAVYHKTKANHVAGQTNYATGKVFHIYRPQIIDAVGTKIWGTLAYAPGVLTVKIPQNYLDTATYPVKIDPTLGYTTVGGTNSTLVTHTVRVSARYTPTGDFVAEKVVFYDGDSAARGGARGLIYASSTNALIKIGDHMSGGTNFGWQDYDIDTVTLTDGTTYMPGMWLSPTDGSFGSTKRDSSTGFSFHRDDLTYATTTNPNNPFVIDSTISNVEYSLYLDTSNTITVTVTSTMNWRAQPNITSITGECWGGGGGGEILANSGGGGGGGGAYAKSTITVTPGSSYTITIGTGGLANTAGGDSYFNDGTVLLADGGGGATDGSTTGATGGQVSGSSSIGNLIESAGGNGGNGNDTEDSGGGGGGAGGPDGSGNNGTNGTTAGGNGGSGDAGSGGAGGAGGNGGICSNGSDHNNGGGGGGGGDDGYGNCFGGTPGGGGSGAELNNVAGGRRGHCILTYTGITTPVVTYCGHTGGDWFVNTDCYISQNTTTNGFLYIGSGGQLHCIDGVTISSKGIKGKSGTKVTGDQGCKFKFWKPT